MRRRDCPRRAVPRTAVVLLAALLGAAFAANVVEADETFTVTPTISGLATGVSGVSGVTGVAGTGTIVNDDSAAVTVDDAEADEGDAITFTVTLDAAVEGGLTVTPGYANGTAASTDYTENTAALTFTGTKGETQTFTVSTTEDAVLEEDETFTVGLTVSATTLTVTATDTGTGTIDNDDAAAVTVDDRSEDEGDSMTFTVTLSEAVQGGLTVTPSYTDGTAEKGTFSASGDYTENTAALSFTGTKGETQTFTVSTPDDAVVEADETFTVGLAVSKAPSGVTSTDTGTGTIKDDDSAAVTVNDASADEGGSMTFTVTLDAEVQGGLTVTPSYTDGTATNKNNNGNGGGDYMANTTALSFTGRGSPTGNETVTFTVDTTEDAAVEEDETFTVGLTVSKAPSGVTSTDTGTGTIDDDDTAAVTVSDASADEGDSMTFTVTLDAEVQGGLTVTPSYTNGTAESGDYTANTTALSFTGRGSFLGMGSETVTFTVDTTEDAAVEEDETFTVGLTVSGAPSGVTATDTGTGTVNNDDASAVTLAAASADEGTKITFTATLSEAVEGGVTVTPSFTDKTAVEGTDYTENTTALSFTGTKGETQTFDVATADDSVLEGDEAFAVALAVSGAPSGVTASGADGTIEDDDGAQVKVNDAEADEGGSMTFTVTLSAAVAGGLTVTPSFTDVTTDKSTDYTENTTALSFTGTANETRTFTVATTQDTVLEGNETFTVGLAVSGTTLGVGTADTGTGTVKDDDAAALTVDDQSEDEGDSMTFTVTLDKAVQGGLTVTPSFTDVTTDKSTDYTANTAALSFTGTKGETQTFTVSTTGDAVLEADETFTVGLTVSKAPAGVTATDTGTGTIEDDDAAAVTVDDAKADEGDAITFTVTLSEAVQGGLTVTPSFTDVTAVVGTDYDENTAALSFTGTKGETQTFTVSTTGDAVLEADETFTVGLTASNAPTGTTVSATDTATGTIEDDDSAAVTVEDAKASEGDSITFTVTLSAAVQGGIEVTPSFTDVTAVEGTDYDENTAALSFTGTKGETKTFTVDTDEDAVLEADETFTVGLTASNAPTGTTVTATDTGSGTIEDDDSAAVTVEDAKASEGDSITFTVTLSAAVQGGVEVTPSFTDVTAAEGTDYDENTTALSFTGTAGETQTFTVSTTEDAVLEGDETFTVGLTASSALVTDSNTATGTVEDDDSTAVTVNDASADEGASMTFTVTLSAAVQGGLTVTPDFTDVTAAEGTDYDENTTALSFTGTKGETQTFTVSTTGDEVLEADETFTVGLAVSGTTLSVTATDTATGTVEDDDDAAVTVEDVSASEGESMTFTVTLSAAVQGGLTVTPGYTDVTADEGTDYTKNTTALSFTGTKGETKTFTVATKEDEMLEGDETFTVALTASNALVTDADIASGTIVDDDNVTVTVDDASADEGESITFTVTLDKAVQDGLTVTPSFTDVTATEGTDYDENTAALSFTGTASETQTFTVSTTEDVVLEGDETFTVALTVSDTPTGTTVTATDTGTGTIEDDDSAALTVADASADEGESITFTVTLSAAVQGGLMVTPGYTDVTTDNSKDYTENTTALSFTGTANETKTFTVSTTEDTVVEGDETFTVTLAVTGAPSGIAGPSATGTVTDDDNPTMTLTADPASVAETAGATEVTVTAKTGGVTFADDQTVTVKVGAGKDSATSDKDYAAVSDFDVTITAGKTSGTGTFTLTPTDDNLIESDEKISVDGTSTGALGAAQTAVTLTDDDQPSSSPPGDPGAPLVLDPIFLTADPSSVAEGGGTETVTVTATVVNGKAYPDEKTVTVTVGGGSDGAASGTDYAQVSSFPVTILAEQSSGSRTFTLTPIDDRVIEGDETITLSGTTTDVAVSGTGVTLTDDDHTEITLTADPASVPEQGGAAEITVMAETDGDTFADDRTVTVTVGAGGDGAESGTDYETVGGFTVTIPAGHTDGSATFTLTPVDDRVIEGDEALTVDGASAGLVVHGTEVTIVDDDYTELTLTPDPAGVAEDAGATAVTVTASTDGDTFATERTVTVTVGAATDGAAAGEDYAAVQGFTITIAAGQISGSAAFTLTPLDDRVIEGDEPIIVAGTSPELIVHDTQVTLIDDDYTEITLTASPANVTEEAGATEVTVRATTDGDVFANDRTVTVTVGADDDGAASGTDYATVSGFTITIAAGHTSGSAAFTLTPIDDRVIEGDEPTTVSGTSPGLVVHDAVVTLVEADYTEITLTPNPASVPEEAGTTTVTVTAETDGDTFADDRTVTVSVGADGDEAASGTDYEPVSGFTITIAAGRTSGSETFTLTPVDDRMIEGGETITVAGAATGLTVTGTGVTIVDDDHTEIALMPNPASVTENAGATKVTITAATDGDTFTTARTVTVTVGADGDGAVSGTDYEAVSGFTITIAAGQTSGSAAFTLTPIDDSLIEGEEALTVSGTSPGLVVHGTSVTLSEDDVTDIAMTVEPEVWNEGDGPTAVTVTLTLTSETVRFPYDKAVAVSVHESGVAAAVDFDAVASFTITIPAGARSASHEFVLTPENDTLVEITELITVIGQPDGTGGAEPAAVAGMVEPAAAALRQEIAVLATASAVGMEFDPAALARASLAERAEEAGVLAALVELEDDDAARITLTVAPEEVTENGGPRQVQVTATLAGAAFSMDRVVSVSVGVPGDSARVDDDYEPVESFRITIPKGTNAGGAPFTLVPMDDRELEEDERITVGGVLWGTGNPVHPATVTLLDDDEQEAPERTERVTAAVLPEFTRAWTESVLGAARGCVAPRAGDAGGLTEVAAALHGNAAAVNAGEMALAEALADAGVAMPVVRGGTADGSEHDPAAVDRITLWGEGDYHALGRADGTVAWDGGLIGAHLGVDARLDDHYVAGAGLSLTQGEAEYADHGGDEPVDGTYRSRLTSLHPYLCWNGDDGSNAWGSVGFGVGRVEVDDEVAGRHGSDATAATVGLGGSLRLLGGERLAYGNAAAMNLRSDAWLTRHAVSGDGYLIGATEVITHRARVALHGSKVFALGGDATLTPEAELGVRWDGGPGLSGAGMELGGALAFSDPAWRLAAEVRGRALLVHEQAVRDWGVSGRLRVGPGDSGAGVSIDVQPSYGSADSGSERLWTQGVAGAPAAADQTPAASLSTELGYGLAALDGAALVTPYGGLDWAAGGRSYRLGGRLAVGGRFDLELEGRRTETDDGAAAHEVALSGATSW